MGWTDSTRVVTPTELFALELLATETAASLANLRRLDAASAAEAHQRAVAQARTDGTAVLGPQGQVREWNPAAAALTGLPADQVVGGPMPFPVPAPGTRREVALPGERWLEVATSSIDGYGESVVDFRDITTPKREERAKDLFLATASHELRTPITVIQGFASTLARRWDDLDDAHRREAVETIEQRTATLARLVEQLLLGSRAGMELTPRHPAAAPAAAAAARGGGLHRGPDVAPDHPRRRRRTAPTCGRTPTCWTPSSASCWRTR